MGQVIWFGQRARTMLCSRTAKGCEEEGIMTIGKGSHTKVGTLSQPPLPPSPSRAWAPLSSKKFIAYFNSTASKTNAQLRMISLKWSQTLGMMMTWMSVVLAMQIMFRHIKQEDSDIPGHEKGMCGDL